jgi:hypothetical protein
MAYRKTQ